MTDILPLVLPVTALVLISIRSIQMAKKMVRRRQTLARLQRLTREESKPRLYSVIH
jgi:hypothetical protein